MKTTLIFLLLFGIPSAFSQSAALSQEEIKERLEALTSISSEGADALKQEWGEALSHRAAIKTLTQEITEYAERVAQIPAEIEAANNQVTSPTLDQTEEDSSEDLATLLPKVKAASEELANLLQQQEAQLERGTEIPDLIAQAQLKPNEVPLSSPPLIAADELERAKYQNQLTKQEALEVQVKKLQQEQLYLKANRPLTDLQIQLARRNLTQLNSRLEVLKKQKNEQADQSSQAAQAEVESLSARLKEFPTLTEFVRDNADLISHLNKLRQRNIRGQERQKEVEILTDTIVEQWKSASERIRLFDEAGLTIDTKTGSLLRRQKARLPTLPKLNNELNQLLESGTQLQLDLLESEEEQIEFNKSYDQKLTASLTSVEGNAYPTREDVLSIYEARRKLLNHLISNQQTLIANQKFRAIKIKEAIRNIRSYGQLLDERLLWIASAAPLSLTDLTVEAEAYQTFFSPAFLSSFTQSLLNGLKTYPLTSTLIALVFIITLAFRQRMVRKLSTLGKEASKYSCTEFRLTLEALALSSLLVLPFVLFFIFFARLPLDPKAISTGFSRIAIYVGFLAFLRTMTRENGLLQSHFKVEASRIKHLHRHITWYFLAAPALAFFSEVLPSISASPSSGRLTFLVMMLLSAILIHFLFQPKRQLLKFKEGSATKQKLIYAIAILFPITFFFGSVFGYLESVKTIRFQSVQSMLIVLATLLLVLTLLRWILVSRRRLAKEQALQRYEARLAAAKDQSNNESSEDLPTLEEMEASAVNVVDVETQTRKLVKTGAVLICAFGLWTVWASSFTALGVLDNIQLWGGEATALGVLDNIQLWGGEATAITTVATSEGESDAANETAMPQLLPTGTPNASATDQPVDLGKGAVTLQDILLTVLIIALTLIAARNLPGLLELSLLGRLKLKPGANFAFTTILRYGILSIGFVIAFSKIGITWGSVQWLAAAVSLGIGFGLQEIFANFVAGIILLFERPIRLGDVVTVGGVSGKVTQIKIRATTIQQFDNRELIVPNKEFITGQLVNWTLKDSMMRFDILIGVAYGSDTKKVTRLLREIATDSPKTLKDPAIQVIFNDFGASTLDFILRAHVSKIADLVATQSDIRHEITRIFDENDIEIAFPQQDIHIRTLPENATLALPVEPTPGKPA